jgi:hypothetical protein
MTHRDRRGDNPDHDADHRRKIAGRFEHDHDHRDRSADDRGRDRAHPDHGIDQRVGADLRGEPDQRGAEKAAEQASEEERGAK